MARSRQVAWEFFGAELKRRREAAGFTQQELGSRVFVSGGYIGQFEQAFRKPQVDVAERIDEALETGGFFARLCEKLIHHPSVIHYFAPVAELEQHATKICEYDPMVVPGLLQMPGYTRALVVAATPLKPDEFVEEMVSVRMDRSHIFKRATTPAYWVILHEAALRIPVGGPDTMADQLDHVARFAHERRIVVQVIPYAAGPPAAVRPLRLMEFEDAPPTAYTEGQFSGELLDDPATVTRSREVYDHLRALALSPDASLHLIDTAAEGWRQCAHRT
ncbi:helix-turn-helix transcriptional regulator [Streptomyces sp. NPDC042319]|uniref:helix-turn-helix domain-containing protein n=1 Tax=Streptomyces sp. NPDC042319 TaxID=3154332 RepID=UPI0033C35B13